MSPSQDRAPLAILLLAAGASSRMRGADKLLEDVDGKPLLEQRVAAALATGFPVIVALPAAPDGAARRAICASFEGLEIVPVADAGAGMAHSIRAGIRVLPDSIRGVFVLPADMPEIDTGDLLTLARAFDGEAILRGAAQGDPAPGHPVLFPARDFAALRAIEGDDGARAVVRAGRDRLKLVTLPGRHAVTDLDTPEAWAAWRAARAR